MKDARFEETAPAERPLRLKAETEEDLAVVSSLAQDAVGKVADIRWAKAKQRLVMVLNRFRWEDKPAADEAARPYERVQAALTVDCATRVRAAGIEPGATDTVVSVLSLGYEPRGDGDCGGTLTVTFAGGAALAVEVEALEVSLADITRPWTAQAQRAPDHGV